MPTDSRPTDLKPPRDLPRRKRLPPQHHQNLPPNGISDRPHHLVHRKSVTNRLRVKQRRALHRPRPPPPSHPDRPSRPPHHPQPPKPPTGTHPTPAPKAPCHPRRPRRQHALPAKVDFPADHGPHAPTPTPAPPTAPRHHRTAAHRTAPRTATHRARVPGVAVIQAESSARDAPHRAPRRTARRTARTAVPRTAAPPHHYGRRRPHRTALRRSGRRAETDPGLSPHTRPRGLARSRSQGGGARAARPNQNELLDPGAMGGLTASGPGPLPSLEGRAGSTDEGKLPTLAEALRSAGATRSAEAPRPAGALRSADTSRPVGTFSSERAV
ncbi:hypothetical protein CLV70_110118 [Pseudosporangium ferrugineum]|uniref:Uncharacterized protein n=1 Tax=Pseudosporangium ferrugineum TaxID=439699 RepID=A0A2T0S290_9ACTN|nr:hypothetical protein CLV70_110118 [Pseudosporangium ferrugineum]